MPRPKKRSNSLISSAPSIPIPSSVGGSSSGSEEEEGPNSTNVYTFRASRPIALKVAPKVPVRLHARRWNDGDLIWVPHSIPQVKKSPLNFEFVKLRGPVASHIRLIEERPEEGVYKFSIQGEPTNEKKGQILTCRGYCLHIEVRSDPVKYQTIYINTKSNHVAPGPQIIDTTTDDIEKRGQNMLEMKKHKKRKARASKDSTLEENIEEIVAGSILDISRQLHQQEPFFHPAFSLRRSYDSSISALNCSSGSVVATLTQSSDSITSLGDSQVINLRDSQNSQDSTIAEPNPSVDASESNTIITTTTTATTATTATPSTPPTPPTIPTEKIDTSDSTSNTINTISRSVMEAPTSDSNSTHGNGVASKSIFSTSVAMSPAKKRFKLSFFENSNVEPTTSVV